MSTDPFEVRLRAWPINSALWQVAIANQKATSWTTYVVDSGAGPITRRAANAMGGWTGPDIKLPEDVERVIRAHPPIARALEESDEGTQLFIGWTVSNDETLERVLY